MTDEILKKLEQRVGRRTFLRGSSLAAVALVGAAVASPVLGFAQQLPPDKKADGKKKDEKTDKKDEKVDEAEKVDPKPAETDRKSDDKKKDDDSETKIDADGREYRVCPQCGSNMYREGRTWTCENCGYSYVE
jgi:ribosomal protein S27AE